jgi:hypothetical protein
VIACPEVADAVIDGALSHTEIQAARLLTFQTAWKMDRFGADEVRAELGMIKAHVSKVVLARHVLKKYRPVQGRPTDHLPSRRPAAEQKWQALRQEAGVA